MALSIRQFDSEFLTEPELEYSVLTYLPLSTLLRSKLVSHAWHAMIKQLPWEEIFRRDPDRQSHFIKALVHNIRQKEYEQIHYWINLGAESKLNFDDRYTGRNRIQVEFPMEEWGLYSKFENPTILSIAANLLSGKHGAKVIFSLLYNDADPLATSKSHGTHLIGNEEHCTVIPFSRDERPSESACDHGIKAILRLAEMEDELEHFQIDIDKVLYRLQKAGESRPHLTVTYLKRLLEQRGVDFQIGGVSRDLKNDDKAMLINMPGFHQVYQYISKPPFFWRHWPSFLAGIIGAVWAACLFSNKTIFLGKCIIGLATTATTGSGAPLLIGSILIGIAIGVLYAFLKKKWANYFHITLDELHIKENPPQAQKKSIFTGFNGALFFKSVEINHKVIQRIDEKSLIQARRFDNA